MECAKNSRWRMDILRLGSDGQDEQCLWIVALCVSWGEHGFHLMGEVRTDAHGRANAEVEQNYFLISPDHAEKVLRDVLDAHGADIGETGDSGKSLLMPIGWPWMQHYLQHEQPEIGQMVERTYRTFISGGTR